ncbi:acid protease [Hypoxylon sp. NC0597]|nr:acid protease [Hypoxylon sp. NC0597]
MHSLLVLSLLMLLTRCRLAYVQGALTSERRYSSGDLRARYDPTISIQLQWLDDVYEYTTQVKIGTPGQIMTVRIEFENFFTPDTVIPSTNATGCVNTPDMSGGCRFGSFNQNLSSTFSVDNVWSNEDGSYAGLSFADKIELGGIPLPNYSMSLLYDMQPEGIAAYMDVNTPYIDNIEPSLPILYLLGDDYQLPNNLVHNMVVSGWIRTPAFSLWFEDEDDYSGELLFSAIDTQRYEGDLVSLETYGIDNVGGSPLSPADNSSAGFIAIAMTSLSASSSSGTDDIWVQGPLLVRVKLGDDLWLSPYLAAQIRNITGAFVRLDESGDHEYTVIPCSMRDSEGYFTFGFGGPEAFKVNVTMRSLVIPPPRKLRELFDSFGNDMCRFGISEVKGYNVGFLSSHLLRSVYTVVDLYNKKVAMAPVRHNAKEGESNIVTFDTYAAPISSATVASGQPSLASTIAWSGPSQPPLFRAAEGFKILTVTTVPPTSVPTSAMPITYPKSNMLSRATRIGIGVGIFFTVVPLLIGAALVWRRWKKRRHQGTELLAQQHLRIESPGRQGVPVDLVQVRPPYEMHGGIQPAELSAVKEPSELCGLEPYPELPGTPVPHKDGKLELRENEPGNSELAVELRP